jgi:predicted nucleotidyltransferase
MGALLTAPAAATFLAISEQGAMTLTEIARTVGKPISTVQRAVDSLVAAGVIQRASRRGRYAIAPSAPRDALREVVEWQLGEVRVRGNNDTPPTSSRPKELAAPATIQNAAIRATWDDMISSIVSAFRPWRIVLFGSQARGTARPDSDVDLLVVFDDPGDDRERRVGIRRRLRTMPFAKDVLVATRERVEHPVAGTALADALREGIVVYER